MKIILLFVSLFSISCSNSDASSHSPVSESATTATATAKEELWEGVFTNGMTETKLSFKVSADGKKITDFTFDGYWRCNGKLTKDILGPTEAFELKKGVVDGVIVDKEAYIRYELKGKLNGKKASGTFRMSITGLGCDTYVLNWTATRKS